MIDPDYVAALERENDELREKVRQLEDLAGLRLEAPLEMGLSPKEAQIFGALSRAEMMTKPAIMSVLYSDRPNDEPEVKIVDVLVCKLRAKCEPFNIAIETVWGRGYRMPAASRQTAAALLRARA